MFVFGSATCDVDQPFATLEDFMLLRSHLGGAEGDLQRIERKSDTDVGHLKDLIQCLLHPSTSTSDRVQIY